MARLKSCPDTESLWARGAHTIKSKAKGGGQECPPYIGKSTSHWAGIVESHPFAECAEGWGTRRYMCCMRKADSSPLNHPVTPNAGVSGAPVADSEGEVLEWDCGGGVRCPESRKAGLSTSLEMTEFLWVSGDGFQPSRKCVFDLDGTIELVP